MKPIVITNHFYFQKPRFGRKYHAKTKRDRKNRPSLFSASDDWSKEEYGFLKRDGRCFYLDPNRLGSTKTWAVCDSSKRPNEGCYTGFGGILLENDFAVLSSQGDLDKQGRLTLIQEEEIKSGQISVQSWDRTKSIESSLPEVNQANLERDQCKRSGKSQEFMTINLFSYIETLGYFESSFN